MPATMYTNDELPLWPWKLTLNGTVPDFSSGWTFTLNIVNQDNGVMLLTKTTGITGSAGTVTAAFTGSELSGAGVTATFGADKRYLAYLTVRRTSDNADLTYQDTLTMKWRP